MTNLEIRGLLNGDTVLLSSFLFSPKLNFLSVTAMSILLETSASGYLDDLSSKLFAEAILLDGSILHSLASSSNFWMRLFLVPKIPNLELDCFWHKFDLNGDVNFFGRAGSIRCCHLLPSRSICVIFFVHIVAAIFSDLKW